jgi:hypothetical protein
MAKLVCTIQEFHRFVGPKIRNNIQVLTKKRKKELYHICQNCGQIKELEAAHIKGSERKKIIENILDKCLIDRDAGMVKVDLHKVEKEIMAAHMPIDKYFKFLCSKCHLKYDSQ